MLRTSGAQKIEAYLKQNACIQNAFYYIYAVNEIQFVLVQSKGA